MTVARRVAPDFTSMSAAAYKAAIDAAFAVDARAGGWFAAHQVYAGSPQPDLAVEIDAGWTFDPNTMTATEIAAQTVSGFTIPTAGQNRVDRIVINGTTGAALRVAGTAVTGSPSATPPAIPSGYLPNCKVTITSADVAITDSMITDERMLPTTVPAGIKVPVRQSILSALLDSSGYNSLLSSASPSSLRYSVLAASVAAVFAFAAGHDANGAVDYVSRLTANYIDQGALVASNTNYAYADYVSSSSVTFSNCLVPPQYGYAFDRTQASILNFEGTNGATTTTDDFGNTWTLTTGTISTAQFKYGASCFSSGGGYCKTSNFLSTGDGSWEARVWFRVAALPGVESCIFNIGNASNYGVAIDLSAAGKIVAYLSSTGASFDITSGTAGTATITTNNWHRIRVVFDALAGTYKVYVSVAGAAETADISVSSALKICAVTGIVIGSSQTGSLPALTGFYDAFQFFRAASSTGTVTPGGSAPTVADYPVHFFSVPEMTMYEVTAASASAGINPTMTARNRLFLGEVDTDAVGVSAIRNYAIRGQYISPLTALPSVQTAVNINHNIGTRLVDLSPVLVCITADSPWVVGDEADWNLQSNSGGTFNNTPNTASGRNTATIANTSPSWNLNSRVGTTITLTSTKWNYRLYAKRSF